MGWMCNTSSSDLRRWASAVQGPLSHMICRLCSIRSCTAGPLPLWPTISQEAQQPGAETSDSTATTHQADVTTQPGCSQSGSCWCQGATFSCGESALPYPIQDGHTGEGDTICWCLCFRWHHEQCITILSIIKDTPWWLWNIDKWQIKWMILSCYHLQMAMVVYADC